MLLFVFIISSCANSVPPGGGPPDKTPPKVLSTDPPNKSVNVHPRSISIEFSKYIRKEQFAQHIFLTPSIKTELSWAGKWLYVLFAEPLDSNITVALTLGTDFTDWQNNKPEAASTLIFATGSKLDSGIIRGTLDADKPEGVLVFLYPLGSTVGSSSATIKAATVQADTLDPSRTKPKYRTQIGSKGTFDFQALAAGVYRVFAVRDEYRDDLINAGDAVGCATSDIRIAEGSTATLTLRIARPEDRTPPALFDVQPVSAKHLRVKFSEKLDTSSVRASSFVISDFTQSSQFASTASVRVAAVHLSTVNSSFVELFMADSLRTGVRWRLMAQVRDSAGNRITDTTRTAYFSISPSIAAMRDTVLPRLLSLSVQDSAKGVALDTRFQAVFSVAIDSAFPDAAFAFALDDKTVPKGISAPRLRVVRRTANVVVLEPQTSLVNNAWHLLTFSLTSFKSLQGETLEDSLVSVHFQTEDVRGYGGVSGMLVDSLSIVDRASGTVMDTIKRGKSIIRDDSLRPTGKYVILLEGKEPSVQTANLTVGAPNGAAITPTTTSVSPAQLSPTSGIKRTFQRVLARSDKWEFVDVPPGTYRLSAFYDANGNGVYDYGAPFPFRPAERFTVYSGDITIRPRWTIENVRVVFPSPLFP